MRAPTTLEIAELFHYAIGYDPKEAHKYYEEHKHLKGRRRGQSTKITEDDPRWNPKTMGNKRGSVDNFAKANAKRHESAKAKQKRELQDSINKLSDRLNKLESLIRKREHEEKSDNRKSKAKKERAAKEREKPKSAAEKRKDARDSEQYRDKHKQELKSKAKKADGKHGGGSSGSKSKSGSKKHSIDELKSLATKVKGQIAVAKQKLAAL